MTGKRASRESRRSRNGVTGAIRAPSVTPSLGSLKGCDAIFRLFFVCVPSLVFSGEPAKSFADE